MEPIISVKNLGKSYTIRHNAGEAPTSFKEVLSSLPRILLDKGIRKTVGEEFWALRNVSFEVMPGERIGIIGRNGAGKSTLFKLLSRITEPSEGKIVLRGRMASLLEVGTGFHPELTGRENIFLNGAILGMSRAEVKKKFDEIVDFAGVEKFLDTPVKRYSSGMYVRLGFAVAAHMEPDILVVDEVLAVGDLEFQKKCLGKMEEVSKGQGRTVLFVSHSMNTIERLCQRVFLFDRGRLAAFSDSPAEIISKYVSESNHSVTEWLKPEKYAEDEYFTPTRLALVDERGNTITNSVSNDREMHIVVEGICRKLSPDLQLGLAVYNEMGELMFWTFASDTARADWPEVVLGTNKLKVALPPHFLNQGEYRVQFISAIYFHKFLHSMNDSIAEIKFSIQGGLSESPQWVAKRLGLLAPVLRWNNSHE